MTRLLRRCATNTTMAELVEHHFSGHSRAPHPSHVLRIDPATMAVERVVDIAPADFATACTGAEIGDEIWIGAARGEGVARYPSRRG